VGRIVSSAAVVAGLALLATSAAGDVTAPVTVNLEGDPAPERVVPREVCEATDGKLNPPSPKCGSDQISRRRIEIEDTCDGRQRVLVISSLQDFITRLQVREADGITRAPEIFFDVRSGASGRVGEARLVRYGGTACARAKTLFRYPTSRTTGRRPRGTLGVNSFFASMGESSKRYRGKELRLTETYIDRDDALCCPSFRRVTFFRHSRKRDRYVPFRTRAKRIKARALGGETPFRDPEAPGFRRALRPGGMHP
jgi:hypothetical protein